MTRIVSQKIACALAALVITAASLSEVATLDSSRFGTPAAVQVRA